MPSQREKDLKRLTNELSIRRKQAPRLRREVIAKRKRLKAVRERASRVRARIIRLRHPGVKIVGNRVTGGTPRERIVAAAKKAAALDSSGARRSFYSQLGSYTVRYGVTGEPGGYRSDCSQWVTSIYWSCDLPDPNGESYAAGYTGTLANHGRQIPASQAQPGDLVIWDPYGRAGHVELLIDPKTGATIGHGSPPVDAGNVSDFSYKPGGPRYYTYL